MVYAESYKGRNVLITGGLGFIGSNLAIRLVELDANITIIDSLIPEYGGNLYNVEPVRDKVRINITDVRDKNSMPYLVKDMDFIFNLAGQVSHIDSMENPFTDLEINCRSQLSLLEVCRKNNPGVIIIYSGTRQQYGRADYLPVDEKHLMHPTDVNGINKMAGEWYHILYNNVYNIRTCSLRLTNTYGPRQLMKHSRQGFIYWFMRKVLDDEIIDLFGDGRQLRDFNYVDDVVNALLLCGANEKAYGQCYNLGSQRPYSIFEVVELLITLTDKGSYRFIPFPDEKAKIEIGNFYSSYEKIKTEIGWEPAVSLEQGLQKTIDYLQKNKEYYW
jgi:UDP-glucose 4-epimerase